MFTDKFQEKSAKFGGPSLNCFEVIQLFSEGGGGGAQKLPPDRNRVKEEYSKEQHPVAETISTIICAWQCNGIVNLFTESRKV